MTYLENEQLKNCLIYESVPYKSREWDNIPPIVPKFIINLQKYMMGVTKELKYQTELETTQGLRKFTEAELNGVKKWLQQTNDLMNQQKESLDNNIKDCEKYI